ncbi:MAG: SH3 domain-containing protein [Candidatus Binatia bacterium]
MRLITILLLILLSIVIHASICLAKIVSVKVPKANVRYGPGTKYHVRWSVGKFFPLRILGKKGNWYRVKDFEGDIGWVYQKLTSKVPAVVVKVRRANVRSGPGTRYRVRFLAERGSAFRLIKKTGNWIHVKHADGDDGWIYQRLVWGL